MAVTICDQMGYKMGNMSSYEEVEGKNYKLDDNVFALDLTDYVANDYDLWRYEVSAETECLEHERDLLVECNDSMGDCLNHGDQCTTDFDCCYLAYCDPVTSTCIDTVK